MSRPRLAILGAGPIGLEAALAAVDAGLPFTLYESTPEPAGNVRRWGHVRLFTPWSLSVSPRMRRHLAAAGVVVPDDADRYPTGRELVAHALAPAAALPSIRPHLHLAASVRAIGRRGLTKEQEIASAHRAAQPFRLLVEVRHGERCTERIDDAEVVIDATGSFGRPNALGDGGIPAPGERELAARIDRVVPDLEREPERFAGLTTLLVGAGHSAQTAARDLAELALRAPGTRVVWAIRGRRDAWRARPDDPLPERAGLARRARELAEGASPAVTVIEGVVVDRLERVPESDRIAVVLRARAGAGEERRLVDRIVALTGGVGDFSLYRELQVHECYASAAPMRLATALLAPGGETTADCLAQQSHGVETLRSPEPGFFLLGSKSYGRTPTFLLRVGWQQVDELFASLGVAAVDTVADTVAQGE